MTVEGARETSPSLSLGTSQEQDQETGAERPGRRKGRRGLEAGGSSDLQAEDRGHHTALGLRAVDYHRAMASAGKV